MRTRCQPQPTTPTTPRVGSWVETEKKTNLKQPLAALTISVVETKNKIKKKQENQIKSKAAPPLDHTAHDDAI